MIFDSADHRVSRYPMPATGTPAWIARWHLGALSLLAVFFAPAAFAQTAPVLDSIGDRTVDELVLLSFTATANDDDVGDILTFSLDAGAPSGASINPSTGAFAWTPTEAQGPGSYPITVRVTDNGTPALSDFELITVTVNEVNVAPVLGAIGNRSVEQGALLTFTAVASDNDLPANTLSFSLDAGAPSGASINSSTGVFAWTPTQSQGPGDFTVTVRVTDNGTPARNDSEQITISVVEDNTAPVLNAIGNRTVDELVLLSFTATANDEPGDTLTFSLDAGAPSGASINPSTGAFAWTPTEAQGPGSYPITVRVTDNGTPVLSDFELITVTVNEVNVAPVLGAIGNRSVEQGALLTFTAVASDNDLPANTLSFSLDAGAPSGASINPSTGVFTWTPTQSQGPGNFTITVRVTDNGTPARSDSEQITISVTEDNTAPVLNSIGNRIVDELVLLSFTATANDDDVGDILTFSLDAGAPSGASINPSTGAFAWTPTEAQGPGSFPITVRVTDNGTPALSDFELITVTVNEVNVAPVAVNDIATVTEDSSNNTINVTANDTDAEGDTLTVTSATTATGTVTFGGGSVSYTPPPNFAGQATINYTVSDGNGGTDGATVSVTVTNVNDPPVANNDTAMVAEDSSGNVLNVTANDSDVDGDALTVTAASTTTGTATPSGGTVLYTPPANFAGQATINYTISDGNGGTDSAVVNVTVTGQNDPPVANNDTATVPEDSSNNPINVTANDTDPDGDSLSVSAASTTTGTATPSGANVVYTPPADFVGQATINYTVIDGNGGSDSAIVTVTVSNVNDAPVANNDTATVVEDSSNNPINVTANDTDLDGDTLTVISATTATGTVTFGSGSVSYTPPANFAGQATINYTISDGNNGTDGATVTVTVTNVNDPPNANNDAATVAEDSVDFVINVTANDSDPDDDTLTVTAASATNGEATPSGGTVLYTPDPDFFGSDTINYTISDGNGGTDSATVAVTVGAVSDPPVANNDGPIPVDEGGTIDATFNVLDNDTNPDQTTMTAILVTPPANASAFELNADGTFLYTHDGSDLSATDSFVYQANNGEPSANATVTFSINPINDAPVITGVVAPLSTPEDTSLTISIQDLVISDPDNAFPTDFTLVLQDGLNYTRAGNTITPDPNFNGQLSVPATVSDLEPLESPIFLIPVDVTAENDRPVLDLEIGPQTAIENSLFELDASENFSDADGDTLTFSATGLPVSNSITIDAVTGLISGIPTVQDARDNEPYIVTVTATDPSGAFVSDTFDLTVSALDRANIGLTIGVTPESGLPNEQLTWTFTAANPIGPAPGENVELTGSFFGAGLSVAAGSGSSCSITLQTGRADFACTIGALPVGGTASVNFTTAASQATEVVAFGTAAGAQPVPIDPNIADNSAVRAVGVAESFSDGAVQFLGNSTVRAVAAGDFNGDGTLDLVVGTAAGQPVQVYLGDAARESCGCQRDFVSAPISIPDTGSNEGVAVADFDNDGDLDFVVANGGGQPDAVYRNNGTGNFVLAALLAPSNGRDVAVGDFNSDGNIDIAIAATSPNPVYFGDGAGGFGAGILLGDVDSFDVAVGRIDGDQFDDLVFANVGSDSQVWLSDGGAGFTPGASLQIGNAVAVAVADLNGDNLDDLVFGRVPGGGGDVPANPVMINQGGGTFGAPPQLLGISPTVDVLIGDVSDDGLPDLVFVNQSGLHQIWTASGGSFVLHSQQIIDIGARAGVLGDLGYADTDDPGGADLVLGGANLAGAAVYLNDSAGNLGLGDAVAPVITLNGAASVDVPAGTAYSDAGATAADNIDGDITASIVVSNTVNSSVVGSYAVTYNVQDFAGNAAVQVTRTVNVTAAVGRGGGGGGAVDYWFVSLLGATWLLLLLRSSAGLRPGTIVSKNP